MAERITDFYHNCTIIFYYNQPISPSISAWRWHLSTDFQLQKEPSFSKNNFPKCPQSDPNLILKIHTENLKWSLLVTYGGSKWPSWCVVQRAARCRIFVYYESMKRKLKIKPIYECRCNGRLQTKRFSRLSHTGLVVELEHLKIKTRLTNEKFASVKGDCEI
jgi:hypothetical protein